MSKKRLNLPALLALLMLLASFMTANPAMAQDANKQLEKELGAFEITALQRDMAKKNEAGYAVLDAGRGNPNWINSKSRYAFARFMEFALQECERTMNMGDMAGQAQKAGIGDRFDAAMDTSSKTDAFLVDMIDYCVNNLGLNKDDVLKEFVDGIIGDYYPTPSRCLVNTEKVLNAYLQSTLYAGADLKSSTKVFPTEGGSAAMVYIFDCLNHNKILKAGDNIAIATPIFTPYLQIPDVKNYGLVAVDVTSQPESGWDISEAEMKKLEDPSVKAFFMVNPSNPASHALSDKTLERLKEVVKKNPNLIILTDDVYGTFVNNFKTAYSVLPNNTILVYSFSKLYGVTGWRVGLIAVNENNVMDKLIANLSKKDKQYLDKEYSIVTTEPEKLPFAERVVADSRSIGLYHTSGLSTPCQIFMDILALTHLVNEKNDPYINLANDVVNDRYEAFMAAIGIEPDEAVNNAKYYCVFNIYTAAEKAHGKAFADALRKDVNELNFLNDLASKKGVVLMYGPGFNAPEGYARVSLANLNKEDYVEIAKRIYELMDEYYKNMNVQAK